MSSGKVNKVFEELVNKQTKKEKTYSSICSVVSVDETARTCLLTPINGDANRTGRIQASLQLSEGIYIKPVVGSFVMLTYINNITGVITAYSEIEKILITIGSISLEVNDSNIVFNGGLLGGLAVPSLVTDRLNILEDDINDLKLIFSTTWVVAPSDGGAALKAAAVTWSGSTLTNTNESDINNENVMQ